MLDSSETLGIGPPCDLPKGPSVNVHRLVDRDYKLMRKGPLTLVHLGTLFILFLNRYPLGENVVYLSDGCVVSAHFSGVF